MKTILSLLLTCVASFAATTYPVITDNANRQFTGGATNLSLLNGTNVFGGTNRYTGTVIITNAASTLSGNGAGMTNLAAGNIASGSLSDARLSANVPLLNANQTYTGTNTFATNTVFSGPIQNGVHVLYALPSTLTITNLGTNFTTQSNTNYFSMAPIASTNAFVMLSYAISRTSTTTNNSSMSTEARFYVGNSQDSATNLVHFPNLLTSTALRATTAGAFLFAQMGSSSNIFVGTTVDAATTPWSMTNANTVITNVNFNVPWTMKLIANDLSAISTGTNIVRIHNLTVTSVSPL